MGGYFINKSKAYNDNLREILPCGYHYNFRMSERKIPVHFTKGQGSRLWDIDGNEYLDLYCKSGAMILGHCNEAFNRALKEQIDKVLGVDLCDIDNEACKLLSKYIPSAEMIRFGLSGTEMIQNALRIARAYTNKNRFLRFEGHFHGNADNVLGGSTENYDNPIPIDKGDGFSSTEGRAVRVLEDQSYLIPWNNIVILDKVIEHHGDEIAAIILEPICINGGSIYPAKGYLEHVREICDENDIVLIFDEVITGIRIGLGGAQGILNVLPDLTIMGKCISGGGIPISALMGRRKIMELYDNGRVIHAGTFNGYPLGLAAICETIKILEKDGGQSYKQMNHYAEQLHLSLIKEANNAGLDMIVQGPRSCASYHCRDSAVNSSSEIDSILHAKNTIIRQQLAQYGIIIAPLSRMYTNIGLNEKDVEFFNERIPHALRDAKILIDRVINKIRNQNKSLI
ncbi:aspartate aminotransferase family protein [Lutispora saccharofermentans]|uniref:Aminotransferase class III-fold pyridoxal phosphate-dependent enzyme n=1 Tax=Lutispora saccharofermentans TaxID=3024236 RepID=A0ABT1NIN9_9FIRM|nr:aminotransferase class III-fold pyridoxal phosphate-dependent enzyme [Lutispora saccharofermentans]MCQ1531104.1 aminotransferase class III-fold pyridoxal phosphate-dependent enzyme [Lutispora saccharofermentans]